MNPSEVRHRVLEDHREIRGRLEVVERRAREAQDQRSQQAVDALREQAEALLARLGTHMHWEDLYLRAALLEADAWGHERAALLDADHVEQREILDRELQNLNDPDPEPAQIAVRLLELVRMLREDMEREEELLLDPRVLRDDVVAIDLEAG